MQKDKQEVVIVAAKRTAIGSFLGSLKEISAKDLAISVANAILKEANRFSNTRPGATKRTGAKCRPPGSHRRWP